jgi:O-antigen/teichoic acid export membrane protein
MLKRNTAANFLGHGWMALMSLAFVPVYIRYLGIEAYGVIGLFVLLQACLGLLDLGMTPMINREAARYSAGAKNATSLQDLMRSLEWVAGSMALIVVCILVAASGLIARDWVKPSGLRVDEIANALAIMAVVIGVRFFEGIYRGFLLGLQLHVQVNLTTALVATLRAVGAAGVVAFVSPTLQAFFLWQIAASLLSLCAMARLAYHSLPKGERSARFSTVELRKVMRFAGGMMGLALLSTLLIQVDKLLLSQILSLQEFGIFFLASIVAGGIQALCLPIAQSWYPRMSQLHAQKDTKALVSVFHLGSQLVSAIAGSAALFLIAFAKPLLTAWTRDADLAARAAPLVQLLAAGNLLNGLMFVPYQAQLAVGWTRLALRINTGAVLVIIPAILVIAPLYGGIGVAVIWAALNLFFILIGPQMMFKRILIGEKIKWYLDDTLIPIFVAAITSVSVKIIDEYYIEYYTNKFLLVIYGLFIFISAILSSSIIRRRMTDLFNSRLQK